MTKNELIARIKELRVIQSNTRKRYFQEEWGVAEPKVGTKAFGDIARQRGGKSADEIQRASKADLRVQTAYKTVKATTKMKNKIIGGD